MYTKNIVICGSMSNYSHILYCKEFLAKNNIPSIVPKEENDLISMLSPEEFTNFKRQVSNQYLRKIREKNVFGVLVVNNPKNGISNYIGANTFAEIAMAFCWKRKIFLLYDFYEDFSDELVAWQAETLRGNLQKLVKIYRDFIKLESDQLELFNDSKT